MKVLYQNLLLPYGCPKGPTVVQLWPIFARNSAHAPWKVVRIDKSNKTKSYSICPGPDWLGESKIVCHGWRAHDAMPQVECSSMMPWVEGS
jgi:hypothetical protein